MSTWPDTDGTAIDRHVRSLALKTKEARRTYRNELFAFQRFTTEHCCDGPLSEGAVIAWTRSRARQTTLSAVIDHARHISRFLERLVRERSLAENPFAALQERYGERRLAPIVRALASSDPARALQALRPLPPWGSPLGPLMRDHITLMRAMGYRYDSQALRFAAFDRFLQTRPDLDSEPLKTMVEEWSRSPPTRAHAWHSAQLGADLSRAIRRLDPTAGLLPRDTKLQRQIRKQYRQPYIYSPEEIGKILKTAREWPAPRWPLLPATMHTMFVLAYCAGLRLSEILHLNVGDVLLADACLEIRNTKFFKSRRIALSDSAFKELQKYLCARRHAGAPEQPESPLFWHERNSGRYSLVRAEKMLVAVLRRSGLKPDRGRKGPRIHDMRHALVVNRMLAWYREGVDPGPRLPYLVTYLGHKSLHSTLTYLTITQELLQHASERYRRYSGTVVGKMQGGAS